MDQADKVPLEQSDLEGSAFQDGSSIMVGEIVSAEHRDAIYNKAVKVDLNPHESS